MENIKIITKNNGEIQINYETKKQIKFKLITYTQLCQLRIQELKKLNEKKFKKEIEFYQKEIEETNKIIKKL